MKTKSGREIPKKDMRRLCDTCGTEKSQASFSSASHMTCRLCARKAKAQKVDEVVQRHVVAKLTRKELEQKVKSEVHQTRKKRSVLKHQMPVSAVDRELAARVLCRRRLLPFIQRFNPEYEAGWVHEDVCRRLERFAEQIRLRKSPRLMLLMPPRAGKSEIASRNFPAWYLGQYPTHEMVAASYSGALSLSFSRKVREIVRNVAYTPVFPECKIDPASQALENWGSTRGGSYTAVGVGGSLTGKGAHCLLIDDPVKDQLEADSETIRDNIFDWYISTARTRLSPGGGLLVIQTWWHDDDLAGRLQAAMKEGGEQFEVVKYPAINEGYDEYLDADDHIVAVYPGDSPTEGSRLLRPADSALHPERYDYNSLVALRDAYIASGRKRIWSALYQQNPIPDDGLFIEKHMFQWYDDVPDLSAARIIQAWDFAITEKQSSDWTVGVCIAQLPDDDLYVLDMRRFKSGDSIAIADTLIDFYRRHKTFVLGVEDGQIWRAIEAIFNKRCRELKVYPTLHRNKPLSDKQVRASPLRGRMQMGKVFFPRRASWMLDMEQELLRFPAGTHDDIVDALAWTVHTALNFHAPRQLPRGERYKSWREKLRAFESSADGCSHMAS